MPMSGRSRPIQPLVTFVLAVALMMFTPLPIAVAHSTGGRHLLPPADAPRRPARSASDP